MEQCIKQKIYIRIEIKLLKLFFIFQFEKPGRRENFDYPQMVKESVTKALADAKISYNEVKQAVVGYVYGMYCDRNNEYFFIYYPIIYF